MKKAIITNIQILDLSKLNKELRGYVENKLPFLYQLKNDNNVSIEDKIVYRILSQSTNISFDIVCNEFEKEEVYVTPIHSKIENGMIVNALGLTESEMWFNSLSDKEKEFVENLSNDVFSNLPFC